MAIASGLVASGTPEVVMRSAGIFHPQWGYLAPAHSFLHGARIIAVATAVGATAGAAVVVSLLARTGTAPDNSIAAHALVTSAPVAAPALIQTSAAASAKRPAPPLASPHPVLANAAAAAASPAPAPATASPRPAEQAAAATVDPKPTARARRLHHRRRHTARAEPVRRWHSAWRRRRWRDRVATSRPGLSGFRTGAAQDYSN